MSDMCPRPLILDDRTNAAKIHDIHTNDCISHISHQVPRMILVPRLRRLHVSTNARQSQPDFR
jgi:hypothetical protein